MPTGYTAGVADGKITDFSEYALQCAMAFGACITLRDEPLSGEIPEFEPSDHNLKALEEARKNLAEFLAMDEQQRRDMCNREHAKNVEEASRAIEEKRQTLSRYNAMLEKAKAFKSPSPDHDNYAAFLISQLQDSIRWDCDEDFYTDLMRPVPFEEWQAHRFNSLHRAIEYNAKAHAEELERTKSRNLWVRQLKESLALMEAGEATEEPIE